MMKKFLAMMLVVVMAAGVYAADKKIKVMVAAPRLADIYQKYADKFADKYNATSKDKITLEIEAAPADQYMSTLKTKIIAGDPIDIFELHASNELPEFVKAGYVKDITATGLGKELLPTAAASVTINKRLYAVPLESMNWAMLYNKDIFNKLGLKPADTLAELKTVTEKLKASGYVPFLVSYKEQWIPQLFLPLIVGSVDSKTGFIGKMNNDKTSFTKIKAQIFDVMDLVNGNSNERGLSIGGTDGCAEFASGKYGMWVQGPWFAETILDVNKKMNFGVAALPIDNKKADTQIMQAVSTAFAISPKSKNQDIAVEFFKYMYSKEVSNDFFTELKFNPIAKSHTFKTYPWVEDTINYIKEGRSYREIKIPQPVKDESGRVFQAYYGKSMSQEQVLKALDDAWKGYNKINK